jgi:hypothetical protein
MEQYFLEFSNLIFRFYLLILLSGQFILSHILHRFGKVKVIQPWDCFILWEKLKDRILVEYRFAKEQMNDILKPVLILLMRCSTGPKF